MIAHIMCLTSSGGIPIFTRKKGEGSTMTFSKMASMSGIHMFLKSQDIKLNDTKMPDTIVVWKDFAESITLIAIATGTTKKVLENFIDAVFNAMILVVGIDEIKNPRNIERLKKELRSCHVIIDKLLECLDIGDRTGTGTDLITMTNSILCSENHLLQANSTYGCILIHGCLAVATNSWWQLSPIENKLLTMAITIDRNCSACDLPVFLPKMSPNVAFRLVSVTLINGIQVLALCGPMPDLIEVEKLSIQYWRSHIDLLRIAEQCYPQCYPSDMSLDPSILGFLLVNYQMGKYIISKNAKQLVSNSIGNHRLDILRTFYYQAVETFLTSDNNDRQDQEKNLAEQKNIRAKETYWCSEYYKCHALKEKDNILCILYTYSVPIYTIRMITRKTMKMFMSDKQMCW
ncbi:hypothetical protein PV326_010135 [Microctonus aethiopoides]|nr:hypothetical protein PV326_010135 [Microctonus aethiopoides]